MKAAFITETGTPDVIQFGDLPEPVADDGQVVIRNHAVCVNPIDTYIRSGAVTFDLPQPFIVGCDSAGVVESVGRGVRDFQEGDRVWCTNQGLLGRQGTFAERIAIDADWCFPLPHNVPYEDAAACALVGITAHIGLFREAKLKPRESVLVIGGSGGVGSMVIQLAKAAGARVIATAGNAAKCEQILALGVDVAVDYSELSILDAVKGQQPDGVNILWETRREPDFDVAVELLAPRGRMILMAGRDARPEFPVGPFYVKECSLHGFVMFKASPAEMRCSASAISDALSSGALKANIAAKLPLSAAAEAHRRQERATLDCDGTLAGKIVLTM